MHSNMSRCAVTGNRPGKADKAPLPAFMQQTHGQRAHRPGQRSGQQSLASQRENTQSAVCQEGRPGVAGACLCRTASLPPWSL